MRPRSTNSIISAYSLIASGLYNAVLVAGAEKTDGPGYRLKSDVTRGSYSFPVHWGALFAKAYMRKYRISEEQIATVPVYNRRRAACNPNALFRSEISIPEVMASRKIVEPLKLLDCSAACEGSSAVLLVSEAIVDKFENAVWINGIGQQTISASFANASNDLTSIDAAVAASKRAYRMAGLGPTQIDITELHDAFSILQLIAVEDLGYADKGKAFDFIENTWTRINSRGGIIGCGHPVGATGVAQVAEIVTQLAGEAGHRQVKGCSNGLVHNLSAAGSSATIMIMGCN